MHAHTFNPCDLENEDEQVPAKIWELLRRNAAFRAEVERLSELESQVQTECAAGTYHGPAWNESWRLVEEAKDRHSFAGIALEWLVPDPLLIITRFTASKDGSPVSRKVCEVRPQDLAALEHWPWWDDKKPNVQGRRLVRGPEIHFHDGNIRRLCDRHIFLNEWQGWKPGEKMFDCETPWTRTPAGFRNWFQFIWRRDYDSSARNPFSGTRADSPEPHESDFFKGWNLQDFPASHSSSLSTGELAKVIRFNEFADARVFAIPRTILTKRQANAMVAETYASLPVMDKFFSHRPHPCRKGTCASCRACYLCRLPALTVTFKCPRTNSP
jgi:hypothetical protein